MKKVTSLFLLFVILLSALTIPIAAEDNEESSRMFNGFFDLFNQIGDMFLSLANGGNETLLYSGRGMTLISGGYNYVSHDINSIISSTYKITYPIGIAILLLSWCLGVSKAGINTALDFKDKNSIIRAIISFVTGIGSIMIAPWAMSVLTSISNALCFSFATTLSLASTVNVIVNDMSELDSIFRATNTTSFGIVVLLILDLVLMLNILWIALLQCLSPLFIAFIGADNTRKLAMNFIKEYFIALLIPPVTIIYFMLAMNMSANLGILGIIGGIVLGISTLGIASKKLPRLIN